MTIADKIHNSASHRSGFDPACLKCHSLIGIEGIIQHLEDCAKQNEADSQWDGEASAVGKEQRRMITILKTYNEATR